MKLILSRKGFDSSAGGVASPIFPDGTMLSLPIPGGEHARVTDGPIPVLKPTRSTGLTTWEKDALEELMNLASALSDDLAEASRRDLGDVEACSVWSRRRQWRAKKASRAGGASD